MKQTSIFFSSRPVSARMSPSCSNGLHSPNNYTASTRQQHPKSAAAETCPAAQNKSSGGGDSDSDPAPLQQPNRSRQKKFMKNFSQLPTEEVVLQSEQDF